jgi:hypothetical protein
MWLWSPSAPISAVATSKNGKAVLTCLIRIRDHRRPLRVIPAVVGTFIDDGHGRVGRHRRAATDLVAINACVPKCEYILFSKHTGVVDHLAWIGILAFVVVR